MKKLIIVLALVCVIAISGCTNTGSPEPRKCLERNYTLTNLTYRTECEGNLNSSSGEGGCIAKFSAGGSSGCSISPSNELGASIVCEHIDKIEGNMSCVLLDVNGTNEMTCGYTMNSSDCVRWDSGL